MTRIVNQKRHIALCEAYVGNTAEDDSDWSNIYTVVRKVLKDDGIDVECSSKLLITALSLLSTSTFGFALQYGFDDSEVSEDLIGAIKRAVQVVNDVE